MARTKVSVQVFGRRKKLMDAVSAYGSEIKSLKKSSWNFFTFETDNFNLATQILSDLKYQFPIAYVQGWTEPYDK